MLVMAQPNLRDPFIEFSVRKLRQLAGRIEDCLGKLDESQIWWREAGTQNAVGNLVLHLCGNLGQWIGSGVAGEPDHRDRPAEFAAEGGVSAEELRARLRERVGQTCQTIEALSAERLAETIRVQDYDVTVLEAVAHVVEHFAQHTGQILFVTKYLTRQDLGYYRHLERGKTPSESTP
jgi:uncharacterized damage-inducible protein DinB